MNIRNIAIIAHVDHGKTTLVDQLIKKSGTLEAHEELAERAMDSNALERERGITILAKNTAIHYKDYKINIMDTPGHADFGGEVERIMHMVDGVLLVVDAYEGTMPQTRFVLKKALAAHVKPIVVINKVDRPVVRIQEVMDEVLELFMELGADDNQLDFPTVFVSALNGTSSLDPDISTQVPNMDCLFDMIINEIPAPAVDVEGGLQLQPALLDYNDYVGRIGIGRIQRGSIKVNENVVCLRADGSKTQFRVQKLFSYLGMHRFEVEEASAGDIVAVAGLADIGVGETICEPSCEEALPLLHVDEPTIQMIFGTNTSPFAGQDGKFVTASKIEERLFKETNKDVSLKVERIQNKEEWMVSGRGELHLSILIETMRREGYELQVSRPHVILKEIDGVTCEPYEDVEIEAPDDCIGSVIESLGLRRGIMENMDSMDGMTKVHYIVPSRGLIGFMTNFLTMTKGYGIINHSFLEYRPLEGEAVGERQLGVLISIETGQTTAYALGGVESRGVMFVGPGVDVYEGMIVGEHAKDNDLVVNVTKGKQQTNTRSSTKDTTVVLKRPRHFNLEACLDYINEDELVEVTPNNIRLRKKYLSELDRKRAYRSKNSASE
ncbi:translational GTPase TypA [Catenibacterium mitsuokai]|uniref:Large ribosomal subunit assembly factor BipA n=2 Tax=Catenibacterium TaxID=135858 RepID=A0AAW4MPY0_9FIRM|nr:translational GTPase TypA [Catenibacterium mitsuokai]MBV3365962.1 translational GTPase TypA [Catenibacterium mitsuokai]MBV3370054.1 translational GTPase TypA [Catenibacterium mitsuokai]MBV3375347.1 translational GTPase TypA [Catenibacterium mitsuokai]MBV3377675.1 translational GTPase TypA [Catenibacterium mitsuokai]MBV3379930.1 translational GTPase TypA [Catenibacterium mitsuokai]